MLCYTVLQCKKPRLYHGIYLDVRVFYILGYDIYSNTFNIAPKKLSEHGGKVIFVILRKLEKCSLNQKTACRSYGTYINNILSHSSEVWRFHRGATYRTGPCRFLSAIARR